MNPLLNPKILFPLVKNYYFDPGRLKNSTSDEIKRYKDKAFRVIVKHAYKVPLYDKSRNQAEFS